MSLKLCIKHLNHWVANHLYLLVIFTLVAVIGSKIGGHQSAWFDKIEKRIDLTSHTLSFLHPVKLLGLSRIMEEKLHKRREDELQTSQKFRVTNCAALAFGMNTP